MSIQSAMGKPYLGAYIWGGVLEKGDGIEQFHNSVKFILDHGYDAVRFAVTPGSLKQYHLDTAPCAVGKNLTCYLRLMLATPSFDDPRLRYIMMTMEDFASDGRAKTDIDALHASLPAMKQEYLGALTYLAQRFRGHPVRIVISNWEGDNVVFCGSAYKYAKNASFRASCRADGKLQNRLRAFMAWLQFRHDTIRAFNAGHPGVAIEYAPEFNVVSLLRDTCRGACAGDATVLSSLAAEGKHGLCSYSSYDSINTYKLDAGLAEIGQTCDRVVIGELGFKSINKTRAELQARYASVVPAINRFGAKLDAIFIWNAFEWSHSGDPGFGLYTSDGDPRIVTDLPPGLFAATISQVAR